MKQQGLALEPFVRAYQRNTANLLWLTGQTEAAIALLALSPSDADSAERLAAFHASSGRYGEAADALRAIRPGLYQPGTVEEAIQLLRTAPSAADLPDRVRRPTQLDFVYLYVGAPERVLDFYEHNAEAGYASAIRASFLWHPSVAPARKTERFKTLMRKMGLVDYWRAKGWPEFCRPMGADDFVCD
jgi:hypothetical protein